MLDYGQALTSDALYQEYLVKKEALSVNNFMVLGKGQKESFEQMREENQELVRMYKDLYGKYERELGKLFEERLCEVENNRKEVLGRENEEIKD